jgi:NAD-dependent dihydropyrimidine dehydrogenase PreA subunit
MTSDDHIYEQLRRHLDRQAIGFPASRKGAHLKVLRHIFTPQEARLAAHLSDRYESAACIFERVTHLAASPDDLARRLDHIVAKGGLEAKAANGGRLYRNAPLVVGMYELQVGRLTPDFIRDFKTYTGSLRFGLEFIATELPQMRTIPVAKSIRPHHRAATFDEVAALLEGSPGPFVLLECICRKEKRMAGEACRQTERRETCLGMGDIVETVLMSGSGRRIERREALAVLEANQKDGLVLQPSNTAQAAFVCSCCGCCCGMLRMHRSLPKPVDFWSANFFAVVDPEACNGCGICQHRCQVNAVTVAGKDIAARVDLNRCLGCGQCAAGCPREAIVLHKKRPVVEPPRTREELLAILKSRRKGPLGKAALVGKLALDMLRTGDARLIRKGR